jgi:hypothetical protein
VVGPELADGKRKMLGYVTVEEVMPLRVRVLPDPATLAARGPRFVVLPEEDLAPEPVVAAPEPPAPEPAPPPEPPATLLGGVKRKSFLDTGLDKTLLLRNAEKRAWFDCKITLFGKRQRYFRVIPSGPREMDLDGFTRTPEAPDVGRDQLHIQCNEGTAVFDIQR